MSPFVGGTSLRLRLAKTLCIPPIRGAENMTPEGVTLLEGRCKIPGISMNSAPFLTCFMSVQKPPSGRIACWES